MQVIRQAIQDRSKVIIPAFAVERTQDVIYTLGQLIRKGLLPPIPVYVDSPLAISATEIFKKNSECFDQETREILLNGENPLDLPTLIYTRTAEESRAINHDSRPGIIISASGMCDSGRILHHLKHHLWEEASHVVIIGYQAEGTVGRRIVDGAKTIKLLGEEIAVKAHIHTLGGFSAHADQKGLLDWLSHFKNPNLEVIVNHGEEKISLGLAELVHQTYPFKTTVPQWRERKVVFGPRESEVPELATPAEGREGIPPHADTFSHLSTHLDRNYRKLRRKIRKSMSSGKTLHDPRWLRRLEEINDQLKDLEEEL